MDWHSSVRTHYETLDNEAPNEDEQIATWYMIPWINIQRRLHYERGLFIGFCFTEILPVVSGHHTLHVFILTPHIAGFMDHSKYTDGFECRENII